MNRLQLPGSRGASSRLGLGVMLVAINLRPAATCVGPLLNRVQSQDGLSTGWASALTTLPVLCFGLDFAFGQRPPRSRRWSGCPSRPGGAHLGMIQLPRPTCGRRTPFAGLLRSPLAWQVTLFFALQSGGFYATLSWLPSIFRSHGASEAHAGVLLSITLIVGC